MNQIYLSLGSNLGQRLMNLERAVSSLAKCCPVTAVSAVYETPPWGVTDQPAFLNLCLAATTTQTPYGLLTYLKYVETALGRKETYRWGPRLIDIDIIFYDNSIISDDNLTIPHPGLAERPFVLAPLAEIAPDFQHPVTGLTVSQMLAQVDSSEIRHFAELPHPALLER